MVEQELTRYAAAPEVDRKVEAVPAATAKRPERAAHQELGTYRRVKGLEFKSVFLPRIDAARGPGEPGDDAARERSELARRQLFVAMTRARDLLWLGSVADVRGGRGRA